MTAPARLVPLDPQLDDSADANRERALEYLRRKLALTSGPRHRLLQQELQQIERQAA